MTHIDKNSFLVGYAMEALIMAEVNLHSLQLEYPNFAVQLDKVREKLVLDIKHLKNSWGSPYGK